MGTKRFLTPFYPLDTGPQSSILGGLCRWMPSSISCPVATAEGAEVSGQDAVCVFGKAMTSRIDWAAAISITSNNGIDFQITIQMTTAEGDWIAVVYTLSGTFNRDFVLADGSTVPPTGGQIKLDIITFHQFTEQLLLQQTREIYDGWSLLSQIKLVPDNPPPSIN